MRKLRGGHAGGGERQPAMPPAQLAREDEVERQVECHGEEAHHHRRLAPVDRVEGVHQHLERGVAAQAEGVEAQCPGGLRGLVRAEAAVLVEHRDDRLGEHDESDARRDGQQECQAHAAGQLGAERQHVAGGGHARQQRQRHGAERDAEHPERQLHQPKGHGQPEGRPVAELRRRTRS